MAKVFKNLFLLFGIAAAICLISCEKSSHAVAANTADTTAVSYVSDIQPIFDAKCVSCHKGARDPDLRPDKSYNFLKEGGYATLPAEESRLYKYGIISAGHTSFTSTEEKNRIYSWISQGAAHDADK